MFFKKFFRNATKHRKIFYGNYFTEIIFCKIFYGKTNIQLTLYTLLYEDNCLEI